jgi:RNA polymerase sigma-70 factor (ECF subfamily)
MTDADTQTFKQAMLAALPSLRAFAMSLSGRHDRADDLVQETVMKAWSNQHSFKLGTNMQAWLVTILRNHYYSQMRKRGREVQDSEGTYTAKLSVAPSHDGVMDLADFRRELMHLPDEQREALLLVGASGFSYEEAAEICGCAVGTIKSRVSRARTRLQTALGIDGPGDIGPGGQSSAVVMRAFAG